MLVGNAAGILSYDGLEAVYLPGYAAGSAAQANLAPMRCNNFWYELTASSGGFSVLESDGPLC